MVPDKLLKVLSGLFQLQAQHNRLLRPVTRLKQIICFEQSFMLTVRESLEHGLRIEVPDIRSAHDIQTERTENSKVDRRVHLLHKSCRLALTADSKVNRQRPNQALHQKLTSERQDDGIERHKSNVFGTFPIHNRATGSLRRLGIGQEDSAVHRVGRRWVDQVQREKNDQDEKRQNPCMLQTNILEATEERATFAAFGMRLGLFRRGTRLWDLLRIAYEYGIRNWLY